MFHFANSRYCASELFKHPCHIPVHRLQVAYKDGLTMEGSKVGTFGMVSLVTMLGDLVPGPGFVDFIVAFGANAFDLRSFYATGLVMDGLQLQARPGTEPYALSILNFDTLNPLLNPVQYTLI